MGRTQLARCVSVERCSATNVLERVFRLFAFAMLRTLVRGELYVVGWLVNGLSMFKTFTNQKKAQAWADSVKSSGCYLQMVQ
jgi:hypothetical protein